MTRLNQALRRFTNQTKERPYVLHSALHPRHRKVLQKAKAISSVQINGVPAFQLAKPA